jgi:putative Holliday junction resolvase
MAVDPGEKRIGLAISDPTCTIARTLAIVNHVSLNSDCEEIARLARENEVLQIIVGAPYDESGENRPQVRHAQKISDALHLLTNLQVDLWDEHGSTQQARTVRISMGVNQKKRGGHLDDLAAVIILQNYLDWRSEYAPDSKH